MLNLVDQLKNFQSAFGGKKIITAVAVFLVLAVAGGAFLFMRKDSSVSPSDDITAGSDLPVLTPEEIGMEVTVRKDGKAVMFELTKAEGIDKVEYTIEYEAEIDGETANQGIFGEMNIGEDGITKTDFREFGTCSAGKCRYDNVVSDIKITLKVTKKDGKEYQVEKTVKL